MCEPDKIDRVAWLTADQIVQRVKSRIFPHVMAAIRASTAERQGILVRA